MNVGTWLRGSEFRYSKGILIKIENYVYFPFEFHWPTATSFQTRVCVVEATLVWSWKSYKYQHQSAFSKGKQADAKAGDVIKSGNAVCSMHVNKGGNSGDAAMWVVTQEQDNMVFLKLGQGHVVYLCFITIISVSVCFVWPTSQKVSVLSAEKTGSEIKAAIQPFVISQRESMHAPKLISQQTQLILKKPDLLWETNIKGPKHF